MSGAAAGVPFYKMTGSGNDFIFFDGRSLPQPDPFLRDEAWIRALCDRRRGIGADGVVFLDAAPAAAFRMVYFNSDGSRASLCGNAALCSTRLAVKLGLGEAPGLEFLTDSGRISGRLIAGTPEIDLQPVAAPLVDAGHPVEQGEIQIGYAVAGVPHLVVLCEDADSVDLDRRGRDLRHDRSHPEGANVNFISASGDGGWRMRTFERGVEGETLACGTGAVASALLVQSWGRAEHARGRPIVIRTSSGTDLEVTIRSGPDRTTWSPSLRGEGRIVFHGVVGEAIPPLPK